MPTLVTGVAGFIGLHVAKALLDRGERVVGVDNLNDYYDPRLKRARLALLEAKPEFNFRQHDITDRAAMEALAADEPDIQRVVHLAAQAGVRYSLANPHAYVETNVTGQLIIFEVCRGLKRLDHLVYASSSSVYGGNTKLPFSIEDRVDDPVSLYAATKRAGELMAHCYAHLYGLPATGLRFFTVYGPWGRPDMSAYIFTKAIFDGRPIQIFNNGNLSRDFTYIDDIVTGVLSALDRPPSAESSLPHRIYNLGNHHAEKLMRFIEVLEAACGREAIKEFAPMQPGDVLATYADIGSSRKDLGFEPTTTIENGLPRFVAWYRDYHRI